MPFARHLYVPELPDADLVWRTSGEQRLSNFMLWQAAYAEFVFSDVLWPDVDRRHLWAAIEAYAAAHRRYGGCPAAARSRRGRSRRSPASWLTSENPCSAAIVRVHRSTAGPSTSTVRPQARQTRWWWWVSGAAPVDRLAVLVAQHVDLAGVGEPLQGAVDRRQADRLAAAGEQLVDLLGGAEVVERTPAPRRPRAAGGWAAAVRVESPSPQCSS